MLQHKESRRRCPILILYSTMGHGAVGGRKDVLFSNFWNSSLIEWLQRLLCDTNHVLTSDYSEVRIIGAGVDAVDLALINLCKAGDIVVTQDYGVAAMALGKGAYAIHQDGWQYTAENIDMLLMERHMAKRARRTKKKVHLKGPSKRTVTS